MMNASAHRHAYPLVKLNRVERYLDKKEAALTHRIQELMREWAKKVAKRARNVAGLAKITSDEQDLIDRILDSLSLQGFSVDLVDELTPDLLDAFKSAGIAGIAEVTANDVSAVSVKQMDAAALLFAEKQGAKLVTQIAETTRDKIKEDIQFAVVEGKSAQHLADDIEASSAFSDSRAMMVARTELAFAHVQGNLEGWKSTGMVERKKWIVGDGCCDDCQELDGTEVDIDDNFDYADGPVDAPPAHPNCRCDILPVVSADENEDEQTIQ